MTDPVKAGDVFTIAGAHQPRTDFLSRLLRLFGVNRTTRELQRFVVTDTSNVR